jgi:hypothetical protein
MPTIPTVAPITVALPRTCASGSPITTSLWRLTAIPTRSTTRRTCNRHWRPQDSYHPQLERSNSFERHRFVFGGVYRSGKLGGDSFAKRFFSNWTVASIVSVASGRPFLIITGDNTNFQFAPTSARPTVVTGASPGMGADRWYLPSTRRQGCSSRRTLRRPPTPHCFRSMATLPERRRAALDAAQRLSHRAPRLLQRTDQPGPDHGHVQPGEQIQRGVGKSAVDECGAADGGLLYDPRQFQFAMKVN